MKLSIIIVHYKADNEFFDCLKSIYKYKTKFSFEVIVVDNDEKNVISKKIKQNFPRVKYIKSKSNIGFGAGNNLGTKHAIGEYLFFLNPDTVIFSKTLDNLIYFIESKKKIGIVAPLLLHKNNKPFELQGASSLTPLRGIICLSFVNKLFPRNPIARKFFYLDWDKISQKEVDVAPGTAFVIRKKLFNEISGFDENFFLYFEEFDLCRRVRQSGFKIFIIPQAKIIHLWERSTKYLKNKHEIFHKSRFYYFKKHFGLSSAILVELFCRINKRQLILFVFISMLICSIYFFLSYTS